VTDKQFLLLLSSWASVGAKASAIPGEVMGYWEAKQVRACHYIKIAKKRKKQIMESMAVFRAWTK
jgi:hypothetical protein